jgi:phenylacetate-coenzyme A ligase PaaK-like adenylate-forming protein
LETPYYRTWFAASGVDPESVTVDSLAAVAPTPKAALRDRPAAFVSDRSKPTIGAHTTGTTGRPTVVWFSRQEMETVAGLSAMSIMMAGFREEDVWANCVNSRAIPSLVLSRSVEIAGGGFLQLGIIDPRDTVERLAAPLDLPGKRPRITHLNSTPSYLAALVHEAENTGRGPGDFGLTDIHIGGEVFTTALAERAAAVFGATIGETYGMTEVLPVSGQICTAGHLHIPPDQGWVEVLDPVTHEPAAPGAVGELVITPFTAFRRTTLLLRYATGDLVTVLPDRDKLDCELAGVPATSKILGRMTAGAISTRTILDLLHSEPTLPLPTRYAVVDDDHDHGHNHGHGHDSHEVLYVVGDTTDKTLAARLQQRLTDLALPLRRVELVDSPDRLPAPCHVRADLRELSFTRSTHDSPSRKPA